MYTHSVTLQEDKCIGCTDCIKRCPTEAIRVRGSKAKIIEERCIDCGNCIRICRNGAKKAVTDDLSIMKSYKYKIALPAPSFFAQFPKAKSIEHILEALYGIGFTHFLEVGCAGEVITKHTYTYLKESTCLPIISSSCPVILRLIQRRFPSLIHHVLPIISPMELAAKFIKNEYSEQGILASEVGVFFISPCPAKATEIHRPKGVQKSYVDGVFSMQTLYKNMIQGMNQKKNITAKQQSSYKGLLWAMRSGGIDKKAIKNHIAVDGIENVIEILEKLEDGTLSGIDYIEALACTEGCLGGVLTIENAFLSRNTLKKWIDQDYQNNKIDNTKLLSVLEKEAYLFEKDITPRPVFSLDSDIQKALSKMEEVETLYKRLPQIDCGACGAPTCRCFAEDVMKQKAHEEDCVFILRQRIKDLSEAMHQLTQIVGPTDNDKIKRSEKNDRS